MSYCAKPIIRAFVTGAEIEAPMFPEGHTVSLDLLDIWPQREPQLYGVVVNGESRLQWVSCPDTGFILESRESLQTRALPVITASPEGFRVVGRLVHREGFH